MATYMKKKYCVHPRHGTPCPQPCLACEEEGCLTTITASYSNAVKALQQNEVWIEKEALAGVFEGVCARLDVPFFCCRGYTSQSEMWRAGRRIGAYIDDDHLPLILHFGDHDPSGIDMTNDVVGRLSLFAEATIEVQRLALNVDQVTQYDPPPNPTKLTDSRAGKYVALYGNESWELDALDPSVLADLVENAVFGVRDINQWQKTLDRESEHKDLLRAAQENLRE